MFTVEDVAQPEFVAAFGVIANCIDPAAGGLGAACACCATAHIRPIAAVTTAQLMRIESAFQRDRRRRYCGSEPFSATGGAFARQLVSGNAPSTFAEGLVSGIGHPIIGPDYLAVLLALGIAVGVFRLSLINPFLFVAATICGVVMRVGGLSLPAGDLIVPVSVLVVGLMLIIEQRIPPLCWMAVFVAAGLFHGYSYGDAIEGARSVPLIAYIVGLATVQVITTLGVAFATRGLWKLWSMAPRLAGASCCGVGFAALVTQLIHPN